MMLLRSSLVSLRVMLLGEVTLLIKMTHIFYYRITCIHEEVVVIVLTSYLSFIQYPLEGDKMEMDFELAYSMFKVTSILSLIFTRYGNFLAPGSPFKERDTWKEKVEATELKCVNL